MTDKQPEARSSIDYLYTAVMADTNALEDAKMTLEVIKETDPGVYDEMINDTLSLIRKALSSSILGVIEKSDAELRRLHEVNAKLVRALEVLTEGYDNNAVGIEIDAIEAIRARLAQPEMFNGLTEEQTNATMSVMGLSQPKPEPVKFKIFKPTPPRGAELLHSIHNDKLPWVYDQDPASGNVASMWVTPVDSAPPKKE